MCGVIAVLRRRAARPVPDGAAQVAALDGAALALRRGVPGLEEATAAVAGVDRALRGVGGVGLVARDAGLRDDIAARVAVLDAAVTGLEAELDRGTADCGDRTLEQVNAAVIAVKDAIWAVGRDRLGTAAAVADLAGEAPGDAAVAAYLSIQIALAGLDRLEVRGRDSAGLHVLVTGHGIDPLDAALAPRVADTLFTSGAVRVVDGALSLVYKAAAEIGELGDNGAALRAAVRADVLLRRALASPDAEATVLGHTRWASVGIISQPNAHPLNSEETDGDRRPYVTAVLNGDVDNYVTLREQAGLAIPDEVTTDAKIIPALIARRLDEGAGPTEAFRATVASFEGSVAIAASVAAAPGQLHLALRGSGQALYVGFAEDAFVVASEPYGLVEQTSTYLRMEGEATGGQVVVLDRAGAGEVAGVTRLAYGGTVLPVSSDELTQASITTRDIDRAGFAHFLLKEITEAPHSFRKTLRGRVVERDGLLRVDLGPEAIPPALASRLSSGAIRRVVAIGQGTAAVAARSVADSIVHCLAGRGPTVSSALATELSGFELADDMSDTLVIAVSQSGTTTDTNRTVDLVRQRGAAVLAIVNRRNSDLVDRADGVIYNSDGRDVEMAVPSTKAFYAQIAAGFLLAAALGELLGFADAAATDETVAALRALPEAMEGVLDRRAAIAEAAQLAPARRHWAVVGNGRNRVAAEEVRIKLSELCYKSIACDATEDKKHIDLSSEPLVFVCAAGLEGPTAADVAKEVAIYRAHKAAPVVVVSEGEERTAASAAAVITVPRVHPSVAFVLSAMAGHLFGYEAALSIDAQARPLREGRAAIEAVAAEPGGAPLLDRLAPRLATATAPFLAGLEAGQYDGHLDASTAVRLAGVLRYATGQLPLEDYELQSGKVGTPAALVDDVTAALTAAIDQLTRPVDAIKHQAKTVTVGISRSDESVLQVPLVAATLQSGAPRDRLSYSTLRALADIDPAVAEVVGSTRYRVEGTDMEHATAVVIDRSGLAIGLPSRTERDPRLRGTKHLVAREQELMIAVGASDGRTVLIVPETKDGATTGLTLLHLRLNDRLPASTMRGVLQGYRRRFQALRDAVTETEDVFREDLLADQPVVDLLCDPILDLAARWRS